MISRVFLNDRQLVEFFWETQKSINYAGVPFDAIKKAIMTGNVQWRIGSYYAPIIYRP